VFLFEYLRYINLSCNVSKEHVHLAVKQLRYVSNLLKS
jgi:hypothetical protein